MDHVLHILVPIAVISVAVVLLLGLLNMARGGSPSRSQTLMRWRIALQFIAICIIMATVYFASRYCTRVYFRTHALKQIFLSYDEFDKGASPQRQRNGTKGASVANLSTEGSGVRISR